MKQSFTETFKSNRYFFIPLFCWILIGAILLITFSKRELFFSINDVHNDFLDKLMTVFSLYGRGDTIAFLLVLLLLIPACRTKNYILTAGIFGAILPSLIFLMKLFFDQPRPLFFFGASQVHTVEWLDNYYNCSFPSGHTMGGFGFFMLLSLYLPKQQKPWSLLFFLLALCVGISRPYLGQHFFADIYAGSILGSLISFCIYTIIGHYIKFQGHE